MINTELHNGDCLEVNLTIIQQKRGVEMFDFFKKKEKGIEIGSPVKGKTVGSVM